MLQPASLPPLHLVRIDSSENTLTFVDPQALVWPLCPPSNSAWISLPTPWFSTHRLLQPGACCTQSHRYSTLVDPQKYQHELRSPHAPARSQSHSLASSVWELWVNALACLMHTPQFLNGPSVSTWRFLAEFVSLCFCLSLPLSDYYPLKEVLDWIKLMKLILSTCPTQTGCGVGDSGSLSFCNLFSTYPKAGQASG